MADQTERSYLAPIAVIFLVERIIGANQRVFFSRPSMRDSAMPNDHRDYGRRWVYNSAELITPLVVDAN